MEQFFDKQVEAMYLHMYAHFVLYIKRVTLILWETIKRLPVLWLIKMWKTINTGHHLPVCALISHQTQRSRSQSPYVGRGEPDYIYRCRSVTISSIVDIVLQHAMLNALVWGTSVWFSISFTYHMILPVQPQFVQC